MKRTICKGCDTLLIPGIAATVRSKCSSHATLSRKKNSAQLRHAASPSHKKLVRLSCLNCKATRRIPAPPLSQDHSDPPPDTESAMQVDDAGVERKGKRRKRVKKKVVYKQPFFERPDHILFRGNEMVAKAEGPAT